MRTVVSLGGNAFAAKSGVLTMRGQLEYARDALATLRPLIERGNELVLTHGNGPQVGHILLRVEAALGKAYRIPLDACVAESEGELGYVLELALHNLLSSWGEARQIAVLLTHVVVDRDDPAFRTPSKPIGPSYALEQADELRRAGFQLVEEKGRGLRRIVPSPLPLELLELDVVKRLADAGVIVVAAGGGGIPLVRDEHGLRGVEAVIDKDRASALLAIELGADLFVILTDVPCAYRHFATEHAEPIGRVDPRTVERLAREGHFAVGSMLPKMEAAARFADATGRRAVICDPRGLEAALAGRGGTIVESETT